MNTHAAITGRVFRWVQVLACAVAITMAANAAEEPRRHYDLPSGDAASILRQFAEISGREILFAAEVVRGVKTTAVRGDFSALEALHRLLAGTNLHAIPDERSGAIAVRRIPVSKPARPSTDPPPETTKTAQSNQKESPPMKKRISLALLAGWLIAGTPAATAQSTGTIEGRVSNAITTTALANARVTIEGTAQETATDETGAFRLVNVPAGKVQLTARYFGMEPKTIVIDLPAGGVNRSAIELTRMSTGEGGELVKLDAFNVVAERELSAQALAMNEQRYAANVKNVVARDEFSARGNENIGDFLVFLPGVGISNSSFEPNTLSLRGLPSHTAGIFLDGGEVASSEAGNSRNIILREVPIVNISRVEITKVPTPDMPASGLGGSVNLITKSGFENPRRSLSYNIYGIFPSTSGLSFKAEPSGHKANNRPKHIEPSFDIAYAQPVTKSFAVTAGVSRTFRHSPTWGKDPKISYDELPGWDLVRNVQTGSTLANLPQLFKSFSTQIGAEWKVSAQGLLSSSFQYRDYSRATSRTNFAVNYGAGANGDANFTQGASTGVGSVTQGGGWDTRYNTTRNVTLKYRHNGDVWKWNLHGSWSGANTEQRDIGDGHFFSTNARILNLVLRGDGIGTAGSLLPARYSAVDRFGQPVDVYNGSLYEIPGANSSQRRVETVKKGGRFDLAREIRAVIPVTVKLGAEVNQMEKDVRGFAQSWNFVPNGRSDVQSRLARNFDVFDEEHLARSALEINGVKYRDLSNAKVYNLYRQHPDWFVLDQPGAHQNRVTSSFLLKETITAAFLRFDLRALENRLAIATGVRYERTDEDGRGPLNNVNAQYQKDAQGRYVTDAAGRRVLITSDPLALRKLQYQERGTSGNVSYGGLYPSLNASYTLSENLLLRIGYAKTIGRPDLSFIVPGATIGDPNVPAPTITVNNPELKPWTADNYDLTLETYEMKGGTGWIGAFRKDINDFFSRTVETVTPGLLEKYGVPDDGTLNNYSIVTQQNAGKARVNGLEFGYRQSLTFLPSWARGVQLSFNATRLQLLGDQTADFSNFKSRVYAGGINLFRPRYSVKLSFTHEGDTLTGAVAPSATVPAGTSTWEPAQTRVGLSGEYSLNSRFSVYFSLPDLKNFTWTQSRYAHGTPDYARTTRRIGYGYYSTVGIKGKF